MTTDELFDIKDTIKNEMNTADIDTTFLDLAEYKEHFSQMQKEYTLLKFTKNIVDAYGSLDNFLQEKAKYASAMAEVSKYFNSNSNK